MIQQLWYNDVTRKGRTSEFSEKEIMKNEKNKHINTNFKVKPKVKYKIKKETAVINSTKGYWKDIFVLQKAHFPPKKIYDNSGIFIYHFNWLLHFGHLERLKTNSSPDNPLKITTFKKEPTHNPKSTT